MWQFAKPVDIEWLYLAQSSESTNRYRRSCWHDYLSRQSIVSGGYTLIEMGVEWNGCYVPRKSDVFIAMLKYRFSLTNCLLLSSTPGDPIRRSNSFKSLKRFWEYYLILSQCTLQEYYFFSHFYMWHLSFNIRTFRVLILTLHWYTCMSDTCLVWSINYPNFKRG